MSDTTGVYILNELNKRLLNGDWGSNPVNIDVVNHEMASDPHPQYTTEAEVNSLISAAGGGSGGSGGGLFRVGLFKG